VLTRSSVASNTCCGDNDGTMFAAWSGAKSTAAAAAAADEDDDDDDGDAKDRERAVAEAFAELCLLCCSLDGDFMGLSTPPKPELLRRYMRTVLQ
jgi:hypothetical protein